jgi:NAD(P)H dehydrogenase (quinone)
VVSTAPRSDYAQAAAALLAGGSTETRAYELAGDEAFTVAEFAAILAEASGKPVVYQDLPEAEYAKALEGVGFPPHFAHLIANNSAKAAGDTLFEDGRALSKLLGRPTIPMHETVAAAVRRVAEAS